MIKDIQSRRIVNLWTDASSLFDIGGYFLEEGEFIPSTTQAFSVRLHTKLRKRHIMVNKMMAVLHALQQWTNKFKSARLIIHGDNTGVVNGLQNLSMQGSVLVLLQEIAMILALQQIVIESLWLPSEENLLADILSKSQWARLADKFNHLQEIFPNASL